MPDLLQGVFLLAGKPVAKAQDQLLARRKSADERAHPGAHPIVVDPAVGERCPLVGNEIFQALLRARHVRLEGNGFPGKSVEGLEGVRVRTQGRSQFRGRRIAAEFPRQFRPDPLAALQPVVDMGRKPNRSRVVLDGSHQRLPDPPDRIGGELEAASMVEFFHRPDQAEIAFLDQVREGQPEVSVILRDGDHQLQVVLDEAVLHRSHLVVRIFDGVGQLEHSLAGHTHFPLEFSQALGPLARPSHLLGLDEYGIPQFDQNRQGKLRSVHFLGDLGVELLEGGCVLVSGLLEFLHPVFEQRAELLDSSLDPGGDLAGFLVTRGFRELGAGMGERAQCIPPLHNVARRARDGVERLAKVGGRRFEIFRQVDFFFALQGARAADLLEIRLQRSPLATWIEFVGRDNRGRAHDSGCRSGFRRGGLCLVLSRHVLTFRLWFVTLVWFQVCRIPPGVAWFQAIRRVLRSSGFGRSSCRSHLDSGVLKTALYRGRALPIRVTRHLPTF